MEKGQSDKGWSPQGGPWDYPSASWRMANSTWMQQSIQFPSFSCEITAHLITITQTLFWLSIFSFPSCIFSAWISNKWQLSPLIKSVHFLSVFVNPLKKSELVSYSVCAFLPRPGKLIYSSSFYTHKRKHLAAHASFLLSLGTCRKQACSQFLTEKAKNSTQVFCKSRLLLNENQLMLKRSIWYFWAKYLLNAYTARRSHGLGEIQTAFMWKSSTGAFCTTLENSNAWPCTLPPKYGDSMALVWESRMVIKLTFNRFIASSTNPQESWHCLQSTEFFSAPRSGILGESLDGSNLCAACAASPLLKSKPELGPMLEEDAEGMALTCCCRVMRG